MERGTAPLKKMNLFYLLRDFLECGDFLFLEHMNVTGHHYGAKSFLFIKFYTNHWIWNKKPFRTCRVKKSSSNVGTKGLTGEYSAVVLWKEPGLGLRKHGRSLLLPPSHCVTRGRPTLSLGFPMCDIWRFLSTSDFYDSFIMPSKIRSFTAWSYLSCH